MDKLTDYICEWHEAVPGAVCDSFVEYFEDNKESEFAKQHSTPGYKFEQLNLSKINQVAAIAFAKRVREIATEYFSKLGLSNYIPDNYTFEEVRIKKYSPDDNSRFDYHVDVTCMNTAKRFLIFILYLTDNEAGETEFPTLDIKVKCEKGKMVCFPPTWQYPHAGLSPVKEPKYIMMTSLHYSVRGIDEDYPT